VTWDADVAEKAQEWATGTLAVEGLVHSNSYNLQPPYGPDGENLAEGSDFLTASEVAALWYSEQANVTS